MRVGILIAETERELERLKAAPDTRPPTDIRLVGTSARVTDSLRGIIAQGAHRLTVNFADAPRPEGTSCSPPPSCPTWADPPLASESVFELTA